MTWKNFLWKFALENYIFHIFSHFIYEISFKNFDHSHFIIPIQSDKVVCAKIYRRSFVFSFPRKSYQFVLLARAHFVHSRIFPKRFRHVAKSTDVVVIIVIGAYAERRSRATGIPLYQASFIPGKQYICCTVFSINLLNVPKKDRAFIFVYSSQIDSSILSETSSKLLYLPNTLNIRYIPNITKILEKNGIFPE